MRGCRDLLHELHPRLVVVLLAIERPERVSETPDACVGKAEENLSGMPIPDDIALPMSSSAVRESQASKSASPPPLTSSAIFRQSCRNTPQHISSARCQETRTVAEISVKTGVNSRRCLTLKTGLRTLRCLRCCSPSKTCQSREQQQDTPHHARRECLGRATACAP